jgi:hypothetical protein
MEATARIQAQRELAAAQAQAAQRALTVAREKAAHEVCACVCYRGVSKSIDVWCSGTARPHHVNLLCRPRVSSRA